MAKEPKEADEWELWWDARQSALEAVLGPADDIVGHATVPLELGADVGGAADILYFHQHIQGLVATTSSLIGLEDQLASELGTYELMICHRNEDETGPSLISQLANYTLEAALQPRQTMDIRSGVPEGSTITAFLFWSMQDLRFETKRLGFYFALASLQAN